MEQLVSILGAACILLAYAGAALGRMSADRPLYSLLNLVGSALLAWVAILDQRAGFIILESAWAIVSIVTLRRALRRGTA
jgi:hypothetical protein